MTEKKSENLLKGETHVDNLVKNITYIHTSFISLKETHL